MTSCLRLEKHLDLRALGNPKADWLALALPGASTTLGARTTSQTGSTRTSIPTRSMTTTMEPLMNLTKTTGRTKAQTVSTTTTTARWTRSLSRRPLPRIPIRCGESRCESGATNPRVARSGRSLSATHSSLTDRQLDKPRNSPDNSCVLDSSFREHDLARSLRYASFN